MYTKGTILGSVVAGGLSFILALFTTEFLIDVEIISRGMSDWMIFPATIIYCFITSKILEKM